MHGFDGLSFGETLNGMGRHIAVCVDKLHQLDEGIGKHILHYIVALAAVSGVNVPTLSINMIT